MSWDQYYKLNLGRPVRPVLSQVLSLIESRAPSSKALFAIDLGCGAGIETAELLQRGWRVFAIDRQPSSIEALKNLVPSEARDRLAIACQSFEELSSLPVADLVFSYHSLPFCEPRSFSELLRKVKDSIAPHGYFAGTLFGNDDDWVKAGRTSGLSIEGLSTFLEGLEVLHLSEFNRLGPTALNGDKHWHYWTVIAKRIS
jgi:SAM-dependent methyltransferase